MSEAPPDFTSLARRYLDLWQEQVGTMANDPALAETLAQGIAMMTEGAGAFAQAARAGAPPKGEVEPTDAPSGPPPSEPSRPQAAAAASVDASVDHDGLAARLAALEARVAALESQIGGAGGGVEKKPRRRRAKRLDDF